MNRACAFPGERVGTTLTANNYVYRDVCAGDRCNSYAPEYYYSWAFQQGFHQTTAGPYLPSVTDAPSGPYITPPPMNHRSPGDLTVISVLPALTQRAAFSVRRI